MKTNQITVFKNKHSLLDMIDHMDTKNQQTGGFNHKIMLLVNNYTGNHSNAGVGFYFDENEIKTIAYLIMNNQFPMMPFGKEKGSYQKYGGGKYARIINIKYENAAYVITVTIAKGEKGPNGTVKPGQVIDSHTVKLSMFDAVREFKTLHDYIEQKQAVMRFGSMNVPTDNTTTETTEEQTTEQFNEYEQEQSQEEEQNNIEEPTQEIVHSPQQEAEDIASFLNQFDQQQEQTPKNTTETPQKETQENVSEELIIPSGKHQGKSIEEMNEAYQKWLLNNMKPSEKWQPILDYLKQKLAS